MGYSDMQKNLNLTISRSVTTEKNIVFNYCNILSNLTQVKCSAMSVSEVLPQDGWFLPALSQEEGEEWQGVVKLHLFVVEGADEEESGEAVQSMQGRGHGANHQAE